MNVTVGKGDMPASINCVLIRSEASGANAKLVTECFEHFIYASVSATIII